MTQAKHSSHQAGYLEDVVQQRDWLLLQLSLIHESYELATPVATMNSISSILDTVWNLFQRPIMRTEEDFKDAIDLTPEAMLKERIESYQVDVSKSETVIIEPKKELSIEDVFGTKDSSDEKYWIVEYDLIFSIKDHSGGDILRFNRDDAKAQRKAKLALKLLNQCEPDDIDLLIEMLY